MSQENEKLISWADARRFEGNPMPEAERVALAQILATAYQTRAIEALTRIVLDKLSDIM